MINKLKLNPADYTVVNVEAPEMVAALERGNIDAYAVWEPWVTRGLAAVKNTKRSRSTGARSSTPTSCGRCCRRR
jgi:ABC-type nitrate/sulfonate/bicarbonate transport system substrate-binding protein